MDDNLTDMLISRGIPHMKAQNIENRINGSDLLNLISDIKSGDFKSISRANEILQNFGVELEESYIIKSKYNLDYFLKENDIPFTKNKDGYIASLTKKTKQTILEFIKKEIDMKNTRLQELAGIVPAMNTQDTDTTMTIEPDDDIVTDISDEEYDDGSIPVVTDTNDKVPVECSAEMSQIQDAINNIERLAPEVRVSELKTLVIRIKELSDSMQNLVKSYLD